MTSIVPAGLDLYCFQKIGVDFLTKRKPAGYIGGFLQDEMGCGKTVQLLVALNYLRLKKKQTKKVIVICPAIMRYTWEQEAATWSTCGLNWEVMCKLSDRPSSSCDVLICSYDWIGHCRDKHPITSKKYKTAHYWNLKWIKKNFDFDTVIADEFHKCKSLTAKRTKAVVGQLLLADQCKIKLAATGTPMTKGVDDLYMQLLPFVQEARVVLGKSLTKFREHFMLQRNDGFGIKYYGSRHEEVLQSVMKKVCLRRLKEEVLPELPDKIIRSIVVDIPEKLALESLKFVELAIAEITGESEGSHFEKSLYNHVATMKRSLGVSKCKGTVEYILNVLDEDPARPLVIAVYHQDVAKIISESLTTKKVHNEIIIGKVSDKKRQRIIKEFKAGKFSVLVCNMEAGGVGITLTNCAHMIIAELEWSPAVVSQMIDRIHRISQQAPHVLLDFIIGRNSMDQQISQVLFSKLKTFKKVLGRKKHATRT